MSQSRSETCPVLVGGAFTHHAALKLIPPFLNATMVMQTIPNRSHHMDIPKSSSEPTVSVDKSPGLANCIRSSEGSLPKHVIRFCIHKWHKKAHAAHIKVWRVHDSSRESVHRRLDQQHQSNAKQGRWGRRKEHRHNESRWRKACNNN